MGYRIIQVDAFTGRPFAGNPAGVCLTGEPRPEAWMRDVAREMNLSETAFLWPFDDGYRLRWFTPAVEVDLCGHATLASAHVLWEEGRLVAADAARFHTRSGLLTAVRRGEWIEMDFPATPAEGCEPPTALEAALDVPVRWAGQSRFDWLLETDSAASVRGLRPDFAALARLGGRGVIVTAASDEAGFDFVSRFFAPAAGIDEDPVTGSAHCALGPYWAERLGRDSLMARQVSARGGVVRVEVAGSRVLLGGQAVTVLRGELAA